MWATNKIKNNMHGNTIYCHVNTGIPYIGVAMNFYWGPIAMTTLFWKLHHNTQTAMSFDWGFMKFSKIYNMPNNPPDSSQNTLEKIFLQLEVLGFVALATPMIPKRNNGHTEGTIVDVDWKSKRTTIGHITPCLILLETHQLGACCGHATAVVADDDNRRTDLQYSSATASPRVPLLIS